MKYFTYQLVVMNCFLFCGLLLKREQEFDKNVTQTFYLLHIATLLNDIETDGHEEYSMKNSVPSSTICASET